MAAPIVWSDYQKSIFSWAAEPNATPHAVVEATAGAGKTTVIKEVCARLVDSGSRAIVYLTFSKRLVDEAKSKLSGLRGVEAMTLHSLGLRMIKAEWPRIKVDGRKAVALAREAIDQHLNGRHPKSMRGDAVATWIMDACQGGTWRAAKALAAIVDVARSAALSAGMPDYRGAMLEALREREIASPGDAVLMLAQRVHKLGVELVDADAHPAHKFAGVVDYGDMLRAPVEYGLELLMRLDWIVIDEAQDLSPAAQEMLTLIAPPIGADCREHVTRLLAVGDRRQAIFGFAGADSRSMDRLTQMYSAKTLTLPVTYRCPRSHVAICQRIAPEMQARPDAPEGEIMHVSREMLDQVAVGDLVLCRLNAPLMPLCLRLIKRGVQARIYGRDVAASLLATAEEAEFRYPNEALIDAIGVLCADRRARLMREEPEIDDDDPRMVALDDTRETLRVLLEACGQQNTAALGLRLKELFADEGAAVWLSSVHRAKGLEADTVWIERPDLLPLQRRSQPAPEEGEWCVAFVAASRAKRRLMLITDGLERPLNALWADVDDSEGDVQAIEPAAETPPAFIGADWAFSQPVEVLAPERTPSQIASDRDLQEALAECETLRRELADQALEYEQREAQTVANVALIQRRAADIEAERDNLRVALRGAIASATDPDVEEDAPTTTLTQRRQLAAIPPWPRASVPQRIRYLRVSAGLSQPQLAEVAGVSARTISTAERVDGEPWISLSASNLRAIARALDVTLGDLFAGH